MRNLKRTLSLALAAVMLMGMMVIGAGAASKDFTDAGEIDNVEAVDVMVALGILEGGDKGDFQPNSILTREQAAKIICYMLLGPDNAERLATSGVVFTDVAADRWSAPYIAYCVNMGILAGDGNGNFFPEGKLTGAAFGKMLLVALGYDANIEKYVGSDWTINVATDTLDAGILPEGLVLTNELSRQDAAQMAFQTLTANMVKYANKGTTVVVNGAEIITGNSEAESVKVDGETTAKNYADDDDGLGYQQFCEKYFSKLKKDTTTTKNTADDFARPGYSWVYDGDVVAFVADAPVATYDGVDFDKDVVDDLKDDYDNVGTATVYYNGGVDAKVTLAHLQKGINGYTIEVYANDNDEVTAFVVTEPYVAEVTTVNTDDDDVATDVTLTVYEAGYYIANKNYATITIDAEDDADAYAMIKDYAEDDVLMVFLKPGWDVATDMDATVLAVDDVETLDGKVTSSSLGTNYSGWLKIDGEKYEFANEYSQAEVKTDSEGTFYIYNGYLVHFDGSTEDSTDYLYVVRAGEETDAWGTKTHYAEVVYADGTSESIETDEEYDPGVYSYKYDDDDDNYVLTAKDITGDTINIEKGKTNVASGVTADSKTVYVSIELKEVPGNTGTYKFDSASVYTGYKNVPSMDADIGYIVEDGSVADYVFIIDADTNASSDDLLYIAGESRSALVNDTDLGEYYTYNAVVNGEIVEIMVKASTDNADKLDGLYGSYKVNDDGVYSDLTAADKGDYETVAGTTSFKKASNDVITVGDKALAYTDDVAVYVIDTDGAITSGSINRNYSDLTGGILYTVNDDDAVTALYLVK